MVAGHHEHRRPERSEQLRCPLELRPAAAVRKIARSDDELGLQPFHEPSKRTLYFPLLVCTHVQIGNMEEPGIHDRTRL